MIPKELEGVLTQTPEVLSGSVRFVGTRVPLQALLDTISQGGGLPEFLEGWPDVSEVQGMAVLHWLDLNNRRAFGLDKAS